MKTTLFELAFNGIDQKTLAKTLASMRPNAVIAERMLSGFEFPTLEQVQSVFTDGIVRKIECLDAFDVECLRIFYSAPVERYVNVDPQQDENTRWDYETFKKFYSRSEVASAYSKNEKYPYVVKYYEDRETTVQPEKYLM